MDLNPIAIDFETYPISDKVYEYPPRSVGVSIMDRTGQFESKYYAYGHQSENNCTWEDAKKALADIWHSDRHVVMHNSSFDMAICYEEFKLNYLNENRYHDTLFLAFLKNPYVFSLSLKSLCSEWLGIKPEERDLLFSWLVENVQEAAKKPKSAGAYIYLAPGSLVGTYAIADTRLTLELFDYCSDVLREQAEPYKRELQLMPILNENSKQGVRVDRDGLIKASEKAKIDIQKCEEWLNKFFGVDNINYNSGEQLVKLIFEKNLVVEGKDWPLSVKTKKPLSDKDTLKEMVSNPLLVSVLRHRDAITKINGSYLEPFIETSSKTGRIYTRWNQVRGEHGGTRTGRLSATPTLQTLVSRFPSTALPAEIGELSFPKVRQYLLPDEGHTMVAADFSSQELRLWAFFEGGSLAEKYRHEPNADLHTFSAELMSKAAGRTIIRDHAKTLVFAALYGAGPKKIAEMLNIPYEEARQLLDLYKSTVAPGLNTINEDLFTRYKAKAPFRTIGGRLLKGEPPKVINGKIMNFAFKSLNALIQGSGADMTKEAMIKYSYTATNSHLLMSVHDEIVISVKEGFEKEEAEKLQYAMEHAFELDVPMLAEAKFGTRFSEVK